MCLRAFLSDSPEKLQSARIAVALSVFAISLIVFGFFWDTPAGIVGGIWRIIRSQAGLITDSIAIGGMGAAFVNSGLVTLICIGLLCLLRMPFTGISIASLFLMAGFSLLCKIPPGTVRALYLHIAVWHRAFSGCDGNCQRGR